MRLFLVSFLLVLLLLIVVELINGGGEELSKEEGEEEEDEEDIQLQKETAFSLSDDKNQDNSDDVESSSAACDNDRDDEREEPHIILEEEPVVVGSSITLEHQDDPLSVTLTVPKSQTTVDHKQHLDERREDAPDGSFEDTTEAGSQTQDEQCKVEVTHLMDERNVVVSNPLVLVLTADVLSDVTSYRRLFESDAERSLLLALIHDASCSYSNQMLDHFQRAAELTQELENLQFGTLQVKDPIILRDFGVERFPSLLFVASVGNLTLLLEYTGLQEFPEDIESTARHYYHRLVLATSGLELTEDMAHVLPPTYDSLQQVQEFLAAHKILPQTRHIPHPLPPTLNSGDRLYVQFMLSEERRSEISSSDGTNHSRYALPDDSVLFLQCRLGEHHHQQQQESYMLFDQMSRAISNRRDRFFAVLRECEEQEETEDGDVLVFSIPHDFNFQTQYFTSELAVRHVIRDNLVPQITKWARPSILWFDRQTTAPIVFGFDQKLHAVLVIDSHHSSRNLTNVGPFLLTRTLVRFFRRACRERKEWACLIVPSTETRVLITLGVDMWTPLDRQVFEGIPVDRDNLLPVVVLTDQRTKGKTFTHLLSNDALRTNPETVIADFFSDFENNRLQPRVKSDPRGPRTNAAGVRILTADSLEELDQMSHALIMFVAPTCGHCKRANIIWNRLSQFLRGLEWNFVALFRLDVSENEVPTPIAPKWLPDIYYYSNHEYVRFDWADDSDLDGMELLEWFLAVTDLSDSDISALLQELERTS